MKAAPLTDTTRLLLYSYLRERPHVIQRFLPEIPTLTEGDIQYLSWQLAVLYNLRIPVQKLLLVCLRSEYEQQLHELSALSDVSIELLLDVPEEELVRLTSSREMLGRIRSHFPGEMDCWSEESLKCRQECLEEVRTRFFRWWPLYRQLSLCYGEALPTLRPTRL
jgi:hypothetical protein